MEKLTIDKDRYELLVAENELLKHQNAYLPRIIDPLENHRNELEHLRKENDILQALIMIMVEAIEQNKACDSEHIYKMAKETVLSRCGVKHD